MHSAARGLITVARGQNSVSATGGNIAAFFRRIVSPQLAERSLQNLAE